MFALLECHECSPLRFQLVDVCRGELIIKIPVRGRCQAFGTGATLRATSDRNKAMQAIAAVAAPVANIAIVAVKPRSAVNARHVISAPRDGGVAASMVSAANAGQDAINQRRDRVRNQIRRNDQTRSFRRGSEDR